MCVYVTQKSTEDKDGGKLILLFATELLLDNTQTWITRFRKNVDLMTECICPTSNTFVPQNLRSAYFASADLIQEGHTCWPMSKVCFD